MKIDGVIHISEFAIYKMTLCQICRCSMLTPLATLERVHCTPNLTKKYMKYHHNLIAIVFSQNMERRVQYNL